MNIKGFILALNLLLLSCDTTRTTLKPEALREGDRVALIAPSFQFKRENFDEAIKHMQVLGLDPVYDKSLFRQYGYFAGTEKERGEAINRAIRDSSIKAIISLKGGYGSANLLEKIDYNALKEQPKIIMGRSDVTALLIAIHVKTGLVTFYGPAAGARQSETTLNYTRDILFQKHGNLILDNQAFRQPIQTINPGVVKGEFIGGNLSVFVSLIGTPYFPKDWRGKILFLEDVNEDVYKIDRMLGQLKNAGILNQLSGFVFGTCHECKSEAQGGFSLQEVLEHYIKPLKIPAFSGSMIGHQEDSFTVPIGSMVEIDASRGLIDLVEAPTITR